MCVVCVWSTSLHATQIQRRCKETDRCKQRGGKEMCPGDPRTSSTSALFVHLVPEVSMRWLVKYAKIVCRELLARQIRRGSSMTRPTRISTYLCDTIARPVRVTNLRHAWFLFAGQGGRLVTIQLTTHKLRVVAWRIICVEKSSTQSVSRTAVNAPGPG